MSSLSIRRFYPPLRLLATAAFIFLHCGQLRAQEAVDALVITALDVSSSIDAGQKKVEIDGIAAAVESQPFVSAVTAGRHGRIGFLVFAWASDSFPTLVGWTVISGPADAKKAADAIRSASSVPLAAGSLTDMATAMLHAKEQLEAAPFTAPRKLVNIVSDGAVTMREGQVADARHALLSTGATINGIVMGDKPESWAYFRASVIGGKGAFCLGVARPEDLTMVMVNKFVREIAMLPGNSR